MLEKIRNVILRMFSVFVKGKYRRVGLVMLSILCMLSMSACSQKQEGTTQKTSQEETQTENNSNQSQITDMSTNRTATKTEIHFISTGNSDCILIKSEKNVLIDGGQNDDEKRIVEYLNQQNVKKIDYLVSTHPDADHSGGLDAVVNHVEIGETFVCNGDSNTKTYQDFIQALAKKKLTPAVPLENKKFEIGKNTYIQFYNAKSTAKEANDLSLVTLLVSGNKKALFTGDASVDVEKKIMSELPEVDILKVGHHGSRSSTCLEFLEKIKPTYAVICTGKNSYGHPTNQVLSNLKECNVETHRTDQEGNIIFTLDNNQITIKNTKELTISGSYESTSSQSTTQSESNKNTSSSNTDNHENTSSNTTYVGNSNAHKFHYASCSSVSRMNEANMVRSNDRSYFVNNGYEACKKCQP